MIYHYTIEEAAENLRDVLSKVRQGETVIIADGQLEPVALVQQHTNPDFPKGRRILGQAKGSIEILPGFYDPITDFDEI